MVSIIIAVYNGCDYIEKTIYSAIAQDIEKEIIIVDDCSPDNSLLIVEKLAKKYDCLKVLKNSMNVGFCKSVNIGINNALGDYILVLGQDDLIEPDHCRKMTEKCDDDVCAVFCDYELIDENDNIFDSECHCLHRDIIIQDLYKDNVIPSVGLIIDKKKLIKVGAYPENEMFPQYGEYHTWIRLAFEGKIIYCDSTKAKYRRHKGNMTNEFSEKKIKKKLNKYYNTCKKQMLDSSEICLADKGYIALYMVYRTIKVYLLGR